MAYLDVDSTDLQILNALHPMFSDADHMKVLRLLAQECLEGNDISVTRTLSRIIA